MLTDTDLELLDAYLDDTLSADEVEELEVRLAVESDLAAALSDLRAQRAARSAVWRALEPSQASSKRFAASVFTPLRRFNRARFAVSNLNRSHHLSESEIG